MDAANQTGDHAKAESSGPKPHNFRRDLVVLMKVRLNIFVLITTFFGFILASRGMGFDWMKLLHTLLGTAAAAFGSAAFNQLMEVDLDALADMATAIVDGGITISKNLKDPALLPRQVLLYRQFVRAVFLPD